MFAFKDPVSTVDVSDVVPIKHTLSLVIGTLVFVILFILMFIIIKKYNSSLKIDSRGCLIDDDGIRIKTPIYETIRTKDIRGYQTTKSVIVGYKKCSKPMNSAVKYLIAAFFSFIGGLIVKNYVYNIQFNIANPKIAASMYVADNLNNSYSGRYYY